MAGASPEILYALVIAIIPTAFSLAFTTTLIYSSIAVWIERWRFQKGKHHYNSSARALVASSGVRSVSKIVIGSPDCLADHPSKCAASTTTATMGAAVDNVTLQIVMIVLLVHFLASERTQSKDGAPLLDLFSHKGLLMVCTATVALRVFVPLAKTLRDAIGTLGQHTPLYICTTRVHSAAALTFLPSIVAALAAAAITLLASKYSNTSTAAAVLLAIISLATVSTTFLALQTVQLLPKRSALFRTIAGSQDCSHLSLDKDARVESDTLRQATLSTAGTHASSSNPYHSLRPSSGKAINTLDVRNIERGIAERNNLDTSLLCPSVPTAPHPQQSTPPNHYRRSYTTARVAQEEANSLSVPKSHLSPPATSAGKMAVTCEATATLAETEEPSRAWKTREGEVSFAVNTVPHTYDPAFDEQYVSTATALDSAQQHVELDAGNPRHQLSIANEHVSGLEFQFKRDGIRESDFVVLLVALRCNVITSWLVLALSCPLLIDELRQKQSSSLGPCLCFVLAMTVTGEYHLSATPKSMSDTNCLS